MLHNLFDEAVAQLIGTVIDTHSLHPPFHTHMLNLYIRLSRLHIMCLLGANLAQYIDGQRKINYCAYEIQQAFYQTISHNIDM